MKLWNYIVLITTMIIFMEFLGISTGLSSMLGTLGITINTSTAELVSGDIGNGGFYLEIFSVLAMLTAGGAIIIGLFSRTYDTSLIVLPIILFIAGTFIGTFWSLILLAINTGQQWLIALVSLIFIPLGIGFAMSCVDYYKGASD